jgi:hypothetical protein
MNTSHSTITREYLRFLYAEVCKHGIAEDFPVIYSYAMSKARQKGADADELVSASFEAMWQLGMGKFKDENGKERFVYSRRGRVFLQVMAAFEAGHDIFHMETTS